VVGTPICSVLDVGRERLARGRRGTDQRVRLDGVGVALEGDDLRVDRGEQRRRHVGRRAAGVGVGVQAVVGLGEVAGLCDAGFGFTLGA